jgi:hypothetical protein
MILGLAVALAAACGIRNHAVPGRRGGLFGAGMRSAPRSPMLP